MENDQQKLLEQSFELKSEILKLLTELQSVDLKLKQSSGEANDADTLQPSEYDFLSHVWPEVEGEHFRFSGVLFGHVGKKFTKENSGSDLKAQLDGVAENLLGEISAYIRMKNAKISD